MDAHHSFKFGAFELHARQRLLLRDGRAVALGGKTFALLAVLLERAGETLSADELMRLVWPGRVVDESNIRVHINRLRNALDDEQQERSCIQTLPQKGYGFVGTVQPIMALPPTWDCSDVGETGAVPTLPLPLTPMYGRDGDSAELARLLPLKRLVTVVGAGGVGKTELVLAAARFAAANTTQRVVYVDLAAGAVLDGAHGVKAAQPFNHINDINNINGSSGKNGMSRMNGTNGTDGTNGTNGINGTNAANVTNGADVTNVTNGRAGADGGAAAAADGGGAAVLAAIAAACGCPAALPATAAALCGWLSGRPTLLVLDHCGWQIDSAAACAAALLRCAPELRILAGSREPLRIQGEWLYRLGPLALAPDGLQVTARQARAYPALALFVELMSQQLGGYQLTDDDAPLVALVCRRLDGVPLALELAACMVGQVGLAALAAGVRDSLALLTRGRRSADPRHRTMSGSMDCSFARLTPAEQRLLLELARHDAEFTPACCGANGEGGTARAALLCNLVQKSWVHADTGAAVVRYRLFNVTRVYLRARIRTMSATVAHVYSAPPLTALPDMTARAPFPQDVRAAAPSARPRGIGEACAQPA